MSFQAYEQYLDNLCTKNKLVQHKIGGRKSFARLDSDEDVNNVSGKLSSPYVSHDGFSGQLKDSTLICVSEITFLSKAKSQTANDISAARQEAWNVMMQFWKRIEYDHEQGDRCAFMQDLNQPTFNPTGPVNQLEYGWIMHLRFNIDAPDHDEDDWND